MPAYACAKFCFLLAESGGSLEGAPEIFGFQKNAWQKESIRHISANKDKKTQKRGSISNPFPLSVNTSRSPPDAAL
jgi:hypothetical protein